MTKTLILSLVSALTLSLGACIADPSDDAGRSRDLRSDDTRGDFYDGLDQDEATPDFDDDTTHGALDETIDDTTKHDDVTAMPGTPPVAR